MREKPWQKILDRAIENASSRIEDYDDDDFTIGDSPIEKILFAALVAEIEIGTHEHTCVYKAPRGANLPPGVLEYMGGGECPLIVLSQFVLVDWPIDFVIQVQDGSKWAFLAVECDGHDFHERTKQQAKRDRARDRALQERGYSVFRFTGSEIWNDPCKCVDQILDWAVRNTCGLPFK
jgi:hypothetical protein